MSVWTGYFAGECLVSPLKRTLFLPECGEDLLEWASVLYFAGVTGITRQTGGGLPHFPVQVLEWKAALCGQRLSFWGAVVQKSLMPKGVDHPMFWLSSPGGPLCKNL